MICRFDGKTLTEVKQDKYPGVSNLVKVNGKIWALSSDAKGSSIYVFDGKTWRKNASFPQTQLTAISLDEKGQTGFITGSRKTKAAKKSTPVMLRYKDGVWKETNL
jgi:N-acetylneuraminic acid mutarotase